MNDIVERLRNRNVCSLAHNSCRNDFVCEEAAAEIEKLRKALREIADAGSPSQPDAALIRLRNVAREALGDD